jgi:hypothetical protein
MVKLLTVREIILNCGFRKTLTRFNKTDHLVTSGWDVSDVEALTYF